MVSDEVSVDVKDVVTVLESVEVTLVDVVPVVVMDDDCVEVCELDVVGDDVIVVVGVLFLQSTKAPILYASAISAVACTTSSHVPGAAMIPSK